MCFNTPAIMTTIAKTHSIFYNSSVNHCHRASKTSSLTEPRSTAVADPPSISLAHLHQNPLLHVLYKIGSATPGTRHYTDHLLPCNQNPLSKTYPHRPPLISLSLPQTQKLPNIAINNPSRLPTEPITRMHHHLQPPTHHQASALNLPATKTTNPQSTNHFYLHLHCRTNSRRRSTVPPLPSFSSAPHAGSPCPHFLRCNRAFFPAIADVARCWPAIAAARTQLPSPSSAIVCNQPPTPLHQPATNVRHRLTPLCSNQSTKESEKQGIRALLLLPASVVLTTTPAAIDLAYYNLFGSLKIVLLNGHKLPAKQEALKEALVEIFNCKEANALYPWVDTVTLAEGCSCCALIANKFALTSPEILAGQGFSRLLLAGVLLDTGNLASVECTSKDKYMATLLIKGAGRFGCNGLYQILKYKKFDISELKVREILRKDFKKWTRVSGKPDNSSSRLSISHVGMSSIGISVGQLLTHGPSAAEEVIQFQKSEKLRLLMVVSGYYDSQKNFKREILISANTAEHMRNLLHFFNSNSSQLPLKVMNQPGLREELRAFEIDNKITSRKTIERLLEEFGGARRE